MYPQGASAAAYLHHNAGNSVGDFTGIWHLYPKITLDLVMGSADTAQIFLVLGGFGIVMVLSMALSGMANEGKYIMYNDMRRYYQMELFLQSLSCDYKNVESEEGQTKYQRAMSTLRNGDWSGTSIMIVSSIDIVVSLLCFSFTPELCLPSAPIWYCFLSCCRSSACLAPGRRKAMSINRKI